MCVPSASSAPTTCERRLEDCSDDVAEVSVGTSKYFLCQRCQTNLGDKLGNVSNGMLDWWRMAIANHFTGRPAFNLSDFGDGEFLPGY
jgi:hypothetical protein